ncbi:ATP-binding response regulator, partial [Rhizobium sp. K7/93]
MLGIGSLESALMMKRAVDITRLWDFRNNDREFDTERAQGIVRITVVTLLAFYVLPMIYTERVPAEAHSVVVLYIAYMPLAFVLLVWIMKRPGVNPRRRIVAMFYDYGAITYGMAVGGAALLPLFAILMWVTVGNGLRFGTRYLRIATCLALASLGITIAFNGYWRANPFIPLTLVTTALLVPAYISVLLGRLERAVHAAEDANLSKSRFLAQASHDLRQPIHAISLFTACLRDSGLHARELHMVENIDRSLESVSRLFKSLLDVSTLDSGKVIPKYEIVAIGDVLDDLVRANSDAALRGGSELRIIRRRDYVKIDRGLVTTILQNVVANAVKYAPRRPILIGCRRRGQTLAIEVYDQGPGISSEHQSRVFEEFYQVRERGDRDVEGVGLGLPIVRRLTLLLGLQVSLQSILGKGTRVTLSGIPLAAKPTALELRPGMASGSVIEGLRVLLVEDDAGVLEATASLLRNWGCEVQASASIPDRQDECDLLITDYDLGGKMTGTECIEVVRAFNGWPVPTIVMTGHDSGRVREELSDRDIPILSKPVRTTELRSMVLAKALDTAEPA